MRMENKTAIRQTIRNVCSNVYDVNLKWQVQRGVNISKVRGK